MHAGGDEEVPSDPRPAFDRRRSAAAAKPLEFLLEWAELPRAADGTIDWSGIFGSSRPLRVEVGVGNSPFLIEVARLDPDFHYVGLEQLRKRVRKFLSKVEGSGLGNLRMVATDAKELFRSGLAPGVVDHVFVNFPDPWPKRRHAKHRFVEPRTAARIARALRPGGGLSLRTDSPDYAQEMVSVLDATPGFANRHGPSTFAPRSLYPFPTPFELLWIAEGRDVFRLEYVREPPSA